VLEALRARVVAAALLGAIAVVVMLPAGASAATISSSYAIHGYEYFATTTQGRFAGTATGSSGDRAAWNAIVNHTPLTVTAGITGGSARLVTTRFVSIRGGFSGGSVRQTSAGANCTNQTYAVVGTLTNVTRSDSARRGTGRFVATLTHLRTRILGHCILYSARVVGTISLSF
jgi:hypothetical protein